MLNVFQVFGSTFPAFGASVLLATMVIAAYTFAVALNAGSTGRPRALQAARFGAYGTVALILVAVLTLAYAFVTHDFRIRYVAHYSDRSMPLHYLITALWGGQDGSLLWWLFLLSVYIGVCVKWLGRRHVQLQPYVIATLMAIVLFFCVLMVRAANPFATNVAGPRADGEGLNPLLQNYWMVIHPPCLYTGFVGCSVPSPSPWQRSRRVASTTSGSSRAASGLSSRGCSSASATRSECSGPTRCSAGAATGGGTRWKMRRACRSSRRARTYTR
jgi:cytochrome c-type biogenesis protein CcmF